ncbi:hypothetical protein BHE74_00017823 [Ensete ventricosum]|nr:hypothetical protein BHE74_00017823 [Ensete ventricosum]
MGPPSSAKMIEENLLCLPSRCGLPPCLLSCHYWFRPVCASPLAVVSAQGWRSGRGKGFSSGQSLITARRSSQVRGFYSNSYGASVSKALILFIAYHTTAPHHIVRGSCDETCTVLSAVEECRSCPITLVRSTI